MHSRSAIRTSLSYLGANATFLSYESKTVVSDVGHMSGWLLILTQQSLTDCHSDWSTTETDNCLNPQKPPALARFGFDRIVDIQLDLDNRITYPSPSLVDINLFVWSYGNQIIKFPTRNFTAEYCQLMLPMYYQDINLKNAITLHTLIARHRHNATHSRGNCIHNHIES